MAMMVIMNTNDRYDKKPCGGISVKLLLTLDMNTTAPIYHHE